MPDVTKATRHVRMLVFALIAAVACRLANPRPFFFRYFRRHILVQLLVLIQYLRGDNSKTGGGDLNLKQKDRLKSVCDVPCIDTSEQIVG